MVNIGKIYEGKELTINGEEGFIRQVLKEEKEEYCWIVFKRYKGSTIVYKVQLTEEKK